MSNIEKEIRLKINTNDIKKIKDITKTYKEKTRLIDITCGKFGFDSLKKLGYICRIRFKNNNYKLEIKKYINNNDCIEKSIKLQNIKEGLELLSLLDMNPYLILDRYREVRKYNDLLIYIDEFDTIGPYIEIEYQNSTYDNVIDFCKKINIDIVPQDKYGDIVKEKLETSEEFKKDFELSLKKTLKNNL